MITMLIFGGPLPRQLSSPDTEGHHSLKVQTYQASCLTASPLLKNALWDLDKEAA